MSAELVGYLFGIFILASVLPGAFLAYGLSKKKSWATVVAALFFIAAPLGHLGGGRYVEALIAATLAAVTWWCLARLYKEPAGQSPA